MFDKPEYLQIKPYRSPYNLDLFESEVYFYSGSSTKLGAKNPALRFPEIYDRCLKVSGVKITTNHGLPYGWIWDCESGATGLKMKNKIKSTIDVFYGGDPKKFKRRIVIFGCLDDLDTWATSREEPLPEKFAKSAKEIRDYLRLFERGRVIWLGPGSERIWNYDGRNKI